MPCKSAGATVFFPKQLLMYILYNGLGNNDLVDIGYKYSLQHPLSLAHSKQDMDRQNKLFLFLLKKLNDINIAECLQPDYLGLILSLSPMLLPVMLNRCRSAVVTWKLLASQKSQRKESGDRWYKPNNYEFASVI